MRKQGKPLKLFTHAFGCQMSAADVSEMSDAFQERGFALTTELDQADAVLVGTCIVRDHAEHRALSYIGRLRDWKRSRPSGALIVAGCAAERLGADIKRRFPHVDLVTGSKSVAEFPAIIDVFLSGRGAAGERDKEPPRASAVSRSVTVTRGCDCSCSYCIVPSVRGGGRHRPVRDILAEVERRCAEGAREVVLLGQTVNSWRSTLDGAPVGFADLLERVAGVAGIERVRFMSPHPLHLDEATLRVMAENPKAVPSLHLPAQSGSDRILALMRRGYDRRSFLEKIALARRLVPGLTLTTDFLIGFPSETDEDFRSTLSLLDEMEAVAAYCFKYSPRAGTESARMPDDVPRQVKEERLARLNAAVTARTSAHLEGLLGREVEVLTEEPGVGRCRDGFRVKLDEQVPPGRTARATLAGRAGNLLLGRHTPIAVDASIQSAPSTPPQKLR